MTIALARKSVVLSLSPLLSIFLAQAMHVYLYLCFRDKPISVFITWALCQGIGNILIGYLSDQNCRKKLLIFTQSCGLIGLLVHMSSPSFFWISTVFLGLCFNPMGVARASLVDNAPYVSKVKLMALTFMIGAIPWSLYPLIAKTGQSILGQIGLALFFLNLILSIGVFTDNRDHKVRGHTPKKLQHLIHTSHAKRFWWTLFAAFPVSIAFFFTDTIIEKYPNNAQFFGIEGLGCLFAAFLAFLYRKTPHTSLLTVTYAVGLVLAIIPGSCELVFPGNSFNAAYQIIFFSVLGGFYIPFVYDVVLNASSANHRGVVCGAIEFLLTTSALFSLILIDVFNFGFSFILTALPALALISVILQKQTEGHD
jgi:MFS family permease